MAIDSKDELDYINKIRKIKQDCVKVAYDYQNELKGDERSAEEKMYELPDGSVIELSKQLVYSPS